MDWLGRITLKSAADYGRKSRLTTNALRNSHDDIEVTLLLVWGLGERPMFLVKTSVRDLAGAIRSRNVIDESRMTFLFFNGC